MQVQLPDGSIGEFPDDMPEDQIAQVLQKQFPKPGLSAEAQAYRLPGTTGKPGYVEQTLGGAKHGWDRMAYGVESMFKDLTPEEAANLARGTAFVKETGPLSSIGEFGSEALATAPLAGPVGLAGKFLPKALTVLGPVGGRVLNLGNAARAGIEAALASGSMMPNQGETRLGNAALAGTVGSVLPGALVGGVNLGKAAVNMVSPLEGQVQKRAARALVRTLGEPEVNAAGVSLASAPPTRAPLTTAATADSVKLGELERGARARATADFASHDADVAHNVWDAILTDTGQAPRAGQLAARPGKIQDTVQGMLESTKLPSASRSLIQQDLSRLGTQNDAIANPALMRALNKAGAAVDDPAATAGVLPRLSQALARYKTPSGPQARQVLMDEANYLSDGLVDRGTNAMARHNQAASQAGAEAAVRGQFMSPDGIPLTPDVLPTGTGAAIPRVTGVNLRRALAANEGQLSDTAKTGLQGTSELLRRHEIYKNATSTGAPQWQQNGLAPAISSMLAGAHKWGTRSVFDATVNRAGAATEKMLDEALLNPAKFIQLLAVKQQLGHPLAPWEVALRESLLGANRVANLPGDKNAP